jgi:hypothetical protein
MFTRDCCCVTLHCLVPSLVGSLWPGWCYKENDGQMASLCHTYSGRLIKIKSFMGASRLYFESNPKIHLVYHSQLPDEIRKGSNVLISYREVITTPSTRLWIEEISLFVDTSVEAENASTITNRHQSITRQNINTDSLSVYCLNCGKDLYLSEFERCNGRLRRSYSNCIECSKCQNIDELASECVREACLCDCGTTRFI